MAERTYPRHVHFRGGVYFVVEDEPTYHAALAAGGSDHPLADWPVPDGYTQLLDLPVVDASPSVPRPEPPKAPDVVSKSKWFAPKGQKD